jgi:hydrogenase/urease accessory protein HupE
MRRALVLAVVLLPKTAAAHLVTSGLGPFYDGVTHFALMPEDLLPALALALLAGLSGARFGRTVLFLLPAAWMVGGLVGLTRSSELALPMLTTFLLLLLGGLVALDRKLPLPSVSALAVVVGLLHGFLNGTAMSDSGPGLLGLLGTAATLFVLVALGSAFVVSLRAPWTRIAVRVGGSWIAATGMLLLGWTLRAGV